MHELPYPDMQNKQLFIANWKMQLSYDQALQFVHDYQSELSALAQNNTIVLCPSFDALASVAECIQSSSIALGAQDVSAHEYGAYTGQVAATSLKQIGCSYCIVGHSERRIHNHEADDIVAQKVAQLLAFGMVPIICIGETAEQKKQGETIEVLKAQLAPVLAIIKNKNIQNMCIAYEPIWAIGTGDTPSTDEVSAIIQGLKKLVPEPEAVRFLYGGSVSPGSIEQLAGISEIGGFLVGGASIDFQKFKKIVSLGKA